MKTTVMRWEFFAPFDRKRLTGFKYERIIALGALIWELSIFLFVTDPCASKGSCCHVLTRLRLLTGEETAQRYQKIENSIKLTMAKKKKLQVHTCTTSKRIELESPSWSAFKVFRICNKT